MHPAYVYAQAQAPMSSQGPHVLIVEDNHDTREIFAAVLEHAGYRVSLAATGLEGLRAAESLAPDLVLLDLNLPELDGWEVARRLREGAERGAHAAVRIVIVTAHAQPEDHLRAAELGCLELLEKPIDPLALRAAVRAHLAPTAEAPTVVPEIARSVARDVRPT